MTCVCHAGCIEFVGVLWCVKYVLSYMRGLCAVDRMDIEFVVYCWLCRSSFVYFKCIPFRSVGVIISIEDYVL